MKLRPSDRVILVLLALALASFALYSWGKSGRPAEPSQVTAQVAAPDTIQPPAADTIPVPVRPGKAEREQAKAGKGGGLLTTSRYPGPPKWMTEGTKTEKLEKGETIDLNTADTLLLQKVPGIGPAFARRIFRYRERLGGYYVREQLQEVYGMDRERYEQIVPYLTIRTLPRRIFLSQDSVSRHPYLSFRQMDVLKRLLLKGDSITWQALMASKAFLRDDSLRLAPYLPIK